MAIFFLLRQARPLLERPYGGLGAVTITQMFNPWLDMINKETNPHPPPLIRMEAVHWGNACMQCRAVKLLLKLPIRTVESVEWFVCTLPPSRSATIGPVCLLRGSTVHSGLAAKSDVG